MLTIHVNNDVNNAVTLTKLLIAQIKCFLLTKSATLSNMETCFPVIGLHLLQLASFSRV